jgi:hypothetical protein
MAASDTYALYRQFHMFWPFGYNYYFFLAHTGDIYTFRPFFAFPPVSDICIAVRKKTVQILRLFFLFFSLDPWPDSGFLERSSFHIKKILF